MLTSYLFLPFLWHQRSVLRHVDYDTLISLEIFAVFQHCLDHKCQLSTSFLKTLEKMVILISPHKTNSFLSNWEALFLPFSLPSLPLFTSSPFFLLFYPFLCKNFTSFTLMSNSLVLQWPLPALPSDPSPGVHLSGRWF